MIEDASTTPIPPPPSKTTRVLVHDYEIDSLTQSNLQLARKFIAAGIPINLEHNQWLLRAHELDGPMAMSLWKDTLVDAGVISWTTDRNEADQSNIWTFTRATNFTP